MLKKYFIGCGLFILLLSFFASAQVSEPFKAESFYFKTTGTLKPLLSESAYQAVISAANASGYSEDEIEVSIIVTDRKKAYEERRQKNSYTPYSPQKSKSKKFE